MPHNDEDLTPEQQFGQLVRTARETREWTQDVLARRLKDVTGAVIDQSGIARIESGKRAIRFNEVIALAELLHIDLRRYGGSPTRPEVEAADDAVFQGSAALMEVTKHLAAVEVEVAVASEQAANAAATLDQAHRRLASLQERHRDLSNVRNELSDMITKIAEARAEVLGESDGEH